MNFFQHDRVILFILRFVCFSVNKLVNRLERVIHLLKAGIPVSSFFFIPSSVSEKIRQQATTIEIKLKFTCHASENFL